MKFKITWKSILISTLIAVPILLILLLTCRYFYLQTVDIDPAEMQAIRSRYSKETLDYFSEIAFGTESSAFDTRLSRWERDTINMKLCGNPNPSDVNFLMGVLDTLNAIMTKNSVRLIEAPNSDVDIWINFASIDEIAERYPHLGDRVLHVGGFVDYRKSFFHKLRNTTIIINNNMVQGPRRKHVILEEIIQSLGLLRDSYSYPNSIFFQGYSKDTVMSTMDKDLLRLLYNHNIPTGLSRQQFNDRRMMR